MNYKIIWNTLIVSLLLLSISCSNNVEITKEEYRRLKGDTIPPVWMELENSKIILLGYLQHENKFIKSDSFKKLIK